MYYKTLFLNGRCWYAEQLVRAPMCALQRLRSWTLAVQMNHTFEPSQTSLLVMSFILSSAGATGCLGEPYVALPTLSGITVRPLRGLNEKEDINDGSAQEINVPHPFNVVWSENTAHLVVITIEYICLYRCVAVTSNSCKFAWKWELCRSVEAPRNLLAFHAGYSHPLLSLEQHTLVGDTEHNAGIGEVVVINLLCSLFQTFSVATPTLHPHLSHLSPHSTHFNRLSHSGRYLSTVQSFSGPNSPSARLGIRVYDLLDLWVLETPAEASYLDFKYADLGVDNTYTTTNTSNISSNSSTTDPLVWAVQQVQWKQSDRFTLAENSYEVFFVANTTPVHTTTHVNKNRYSVGIADRHGDYSPNIESPYTPHNNTNTSTSTSSDVSVSIYSVSQQPDYENINILTMAYHAAIVAGQLNQADEYNTNTITNTTIPNTPHISTAQSMARTTTINLLVVVTLDTLCREINTDYSYITNTTNTCCRSVMFAWVEAPTTTWRGASVHGTRKHKDSANNTALWLAAVYGSGTTNNTINNSTNNTPSTEHSVLLCGIQYDNRANSCNDQKQYSYSPSYISNSSVSISTQEPYSVLYNMRCSGSMHSVSRASGDTGSGVPIELCMVYGSGSNSDSVLLSIVSLVAAPIVDATGDNTMDGNNGRELSLSLCDYRTHVVPNTNTSASTSATIGITDNISDGISTDTTDSRSICVDHLLPSANVRFSPVDTHSNLFTVAPSDANSATHRTSELIHLDSAKHDIKRTISATSTTSTTDNTTTMYILYAKSDNTVYLSVWTLPTTTTTSTIQTQHLLQNLHYYTSLPTIHYTATTSITNEYTTTIQPDPHFGLGIRIDVVGSKTVVSSFKRHPITNKAMSAQLNGVIAPGDEFIAINGKVLRGLPLADVIHTIRTTVSEGGDKEVLLTMQKQGSGNGSSGNSGGGSGSNVDMRSAYSVKNHTINTGHSTSNLNLHEVSSTNSINSVLSTTSLTDGLDSGGSGKYNNHNNDGISGRGSGSAGGVCVQLCSVFEFVSESVVGSGVVAADLCTHSTNNSGSGVYVAALQHTDAGMSVVLYSVSGTTDLMLVELSHTVHSTVYSDSYVQYNIQLWTTGCELKCTVLVGHTSTQSGTFHQPVLTMYKISADNTIVVNGVYDCIPVVDAHHTHSVQHFLHSMDTQAPCTLLTYPTTTLTSTIICNSRLVDVQLRTHNPTSNGDSTVPLYLLKDSVWEDTTGSVDSCAHGTLDVLLSVLQALHVHGTTSITSTTATTSTTSTACITTNTSNSVTSTSHNTVISLLQSVTHSTSTSPVELIDNILAQHTCSTIITSLLNSLGAYHTLLSTSINTCVSTTTTAATEDTLTSLNMNTYANRAITLSLLLRSDNSTTTTTNINTKTNTNSTTGYASDDTHHSTVFLLPGAAVANLLFGGCSGVRGGDSGSGNKQEVLLDFLIPLPTTSTTDSTSASSSVASTIRTLLTTSPTTNSTNTTTNTTTNNTNTNTTNTADTNDNTYLNFTATTNTARTTNTTIDILAHLTSIHAALWLHDVTPLVDVIYKHAMAAFRVHKSSIQIFLEMVLIGKEDTLLQLCKTDRNKTGKQLLALLTLDDTFVSDSARRKLQKNAFALMKLHRYRDAAAVFLLARPPFIKEACSVLCRQYNNVSMGLLVARLAEYRVSSNSGVSSTGSIGVSCVGGVYGGSGTGSNSTSIHTPAGVDGFVLGPVSRQLVESDLLPSFVAAVESSALRSVQATSLQNTTTSSSSTTYNNTTATSTEFSTITGINAIVLALVAALWLQDRAILKTTLYKVLHRYSLVDCVTAAASGGGGEGHGTAQLLCVLGSVDWLLEVSAYLGAKHYHHALQAVHKFVTHQHHLHRTALNTALYNTRVMRTHYAQRVRTNVFLQYSALCYTQYAEYLLHKDKQQVEVRDDSSIDLSVSSANTLFTESSVYNAGANGGTSSGSVGDDTSDYDSVMKRISRFQLAGDTPTNSTKNITNISTTTNTNATTNTTNTTSAGIADVPTTTISTADSVPAIPKANGFNFASMSRPSASTRANNTSNSSTGSGVMSALDVFDMPPPPRLTNTNTNTSTNTNVSSTNTASTASLTNTTTTTAISTTPAVIPIAAPITASLADPFAFDFAPPTRHTRASGGTGSSVSAVSSGTRGSSNKAEPVASASAGAASSRGSSANQSVFDMSGFDFSAPVRHTRATTQRSAGVGAGTASNASNGTNTPDTAVPTASSATISGSIDSSATATEPATSTAAPVSMFNFSARPATNTYTTITTTTDTNPSTNTSNNTNSNSAGSVDPFAAFDFAPPTRHVRARPAGTTTINTNDTSNGNIANEDTHSANNSTSTSNAIATVITNTTTDAIDDLFSGMNIASPQPTSTTSTSFNFASTPRNRNTNTNTNNEATPVVRTADTANNTTDTTSDTNATATVQAQAAPVAPVVTPVVVRSALDDFDFFAPPPRPRRSAPTTTTNNSTAAVGGSSSGGAGESQGSAK